MVGAFGLRSFYTRSLYRNEENETEDHDALDEKTIYRRDREADGMNIYYLAPLILAHCIEYLRKQDGGTKYHPTEDAFFLDSKTMARIIRYEGDYRATVTNTECTFFGRVISVLLQQGIVDSPIRKESFRIEENKDFDKKAINIYFQRKILPNLGRPIGGIRNVSNVG